MKVNSGILLLTITLAASLATELIENIIVIDPSIEPEPFYHTRPIYKATLQPLFLHLDPERMTEFVESFSAFYNRNDNSYEARRAEQWLNEKIRTVLSHYKVGNGYLREILIWGDPNNHKNLIAIVEGQDPNKKENLVILGAHYDTVPNPSGSSPGANDNASGCAVLMEVLLLIVQFEIRFKNTVEFHFYTGKEIYNYYGSTAVVSQYIKEGRIHHMRANHEMRGMLNVDSVGTRGEYQYPTIGLCTKNDKTGTSHTNLRLTTFVQMLIKEYSEYEAELEAAGSYDDQCLSDNYSWYYRGYPSALITESPTQVVRFHEDPESDTSRRVYGGPLTEYAKVVLAFAIELGELYEIPPPEQITNGLLASTESDGTEYNETSMAMKLLLPTWPVVSLTFIEIWMLY